MGDHLATRADVSRLYGRAAFGATAKDLDRWAGRPYAEVVEHLLAAPDGGSNPVNRLLTDLTAGVTELTAGLAELTSGLLPEHGQLWWLNQMLTSPQPLEERMTLFWHNHFATAIGGRISGDEMLGQNQTIRRHALGNFRTLAHAMTVDPAMLKWLNGVDNVGDDPNENFSREFFELFSLGAMPSTFTEDDVREAARAFSGWVIDGLPESAVFRSDRHDTGTKVVLGNTIPNLGADEYKRVVDIALAQPIAPKYVAYRLVRNFAYQPATNDLMATSDPLVDEVARVLVAHNWDLKAAVRAMLLSDHFRYADPAAGRQVVRQPIEVAIHGLKVLGVPLVADERLLRRLRQAGQAPFEPPNVGGWLLGEGWLTAGSFFDRYAMTAQALRIRDDLALAPPDLEAPLLAILPALGDTPLVRDTPPSSDIRDGGRRWASMMGLDHLSPTTLAAIQSFLDSEESGNETQREDGIFLLIANSPDWQVM